MTAKFNIFTGLLKAYDGPDGKKRFRTTASSTITDLAGDEILPPAIEKMASKAQGNLTIFLNHEYRVPEDVLGSVESTAMQTRGVDSEGNPVVDLDFDIVLNDANPRALQTWEAIKSGVKLGTSIGAIVRHAEKKKGGGLRIDDLELLEASIVGIPANPRSWVQYAVKSVNGLGEETKSTILVDEDSVIKDAEDSEDTVSEVIDITAAATCKSCGHTAGCDCTDCSCSKKDIEPDKDAAHTSVTVTVESTQDAPAANPGAVLMDEDRADAPSEPDNESLGDNVTLSTEPDVEKDVELEADEVIEKEFSMTTESLGTLVKKLQEMVTENTDLRKALAAAETERDELKENFEVAKGIIDRIADLPIGRKTAFAGPIDDFRAKYPQYDNEFVKMLEK